MSKKREMILKITGAAIVPVLWAAGLGSALAQGAARTPRTFNSTVTHTGPAGNTLTRQTSVTTNGHGGFTSNSTWTGPRGNTATAQRSGQYNPATKTYTSSGTLTGINGKQTAFNTAVQGSGNAVTTTGQGQYNPATGTFNQSRTTSYPNGQSSSESRSVSVAPSQSQGG